MSDATDGSGLSIDGLVAGYGKSEVLHGITIDVARGEAVAILGPNGAGKSTLLNTLSGMVRARAGSVAFNGERLTNRMSHEIVRAGVVHVPEGRQVFPEMSVRDNLLMGAFSSPDPDGSRMKQVLAIFPRLEERLKQQAQTLSGGEQQMLAIGRGLMSNPKLLLLDEPTLGLAPILVDEVMNRLRDVRDQFGTSMLVVEQNAYLARGLCDRFAVMINGTISQRGDRMPDDPNELMSAYVGDSASQ
jgi:branched-chain amino acid transport system ATP-binding protein